jgi:hypothetical protein
MEKSVKPLIGLFIDAENISPSHYDGIIAQTRKRGDIFAIRIWADWRKYNSESWKKHPAEFKQTPLTGKNAADAFLCIDAVRMSEQHPEVNAFCIVTSDADFRYFAYELRAKQKYVLGMGESKSPQSLRDAYDDFVILQNDEEPDTAYETAASTEDEDDSLVRRAFAEVSQRQGAVASNGSIRMKDVADRMSSLSPSFENRLAFWENYKKKKGTIEIIRGAPGEYRVKLI